MVRKTAAEASKALSEQCEALLAKLKELGIEPDSIRIQNDRTERKSRYKTDEILYESNKDLWIEIPVEMKLINMIRGIVEDGFKNVSFLTFYSISNENELKEQLMKEAVSNSRAKAELLASAIGQRIIGVDSANLSGDEDVCFLADDRDEEEEVYYMCQENSRYPLSDKLTPHEETVDTTVKIVWIIE